MPVKDEALLQTFRDKRQCERCGRRGAVEPHHLTSRGFGGGLRFDVPMNLVALCRECHQSFHDGHTEQADLISLVARREGLTPEDWWEGLYRMRREDHR